MQEKAVADKRKKLLRAIPSTIPGVSAVVRADARSDIREIEGFVDMQVRYGTVRYGTRYGTADLQSIPWTSFSFSASLCPSLSPDAHGLVLSHEPCDAVVWCVVAEVVMYAVGMLTARGAQK